MANMERSATNNSRLLVNIRINKYLNYSCRGMLVSSV